MRLLSVTLVALSFLAFLVGVLGNLIELGGGAGVILWPPLAWWRGAMYLLLLAVALGRPRRHAAA